MLLELFKMDFALWTTSTNEIISVVVNKGEKYYQVIPLDVEILD